MERVQKALADDLLSTFREKVSKCNDTDVLYGMLNMLKERILNVEAGPSIVVNDGESHTPCYSPDDVDIPSTETRFLDENPDYQYDWYEGNESNAMITEPQHLTTGESLNSTDSENDESSGSEAIATEPQHLTTGESLTSDDSENAELSFAVTTEQTDANTKQKREKPVWYPLCVHVNAEEHAQFMKENHFSTYLTLERAETTTRYMRCNLVKKKGTQCAARLVVRMSKRDTEYKVETNRFAHTHEEIHNKVLPAERKRIEDYRQAQIKPAKALQLAQKEFGEKAPRLTQIYHSNRIHLEKSGEKLVNMGQLTEWMHTSTIEETEIDPYILDYNYLDTEFQYVFSTSRLLENALSLKIVAVDGTYKLNVHGYPLLVLGGIDTNQKYHLLALSITTKETATNYKFLFRAVKNAIWRLFHKEWEPEILLADAAGAITNGFSAAFPNLNYKRIMCWFHVTQAIEQKLKKEPHRLEVKADIVKIHLSHSPAMFTRSVELFILKWSDKLPSFCAYFDKYWVRMNSGWYEGFCSRCPSTNNGAEGCNSGIKANQTLRNLLPLGKLNKELFDLLNTRSLQYTNGVRNISNTKVIDDECWVAAQKWNSDKIQTVSMAGGLHQSICYIPSTESIKCGEALSREKIECFKKMSGSTFEEFTTLMFSMWKVQFDFNDFNKSQCTCPHWIRTGICKHIVGIAITQKVIEIPPGLNIALLKQPQKRNRNTKATKALTRQPGYDEPSVSNIAASSQPYIHSEAPSVPSTQSSNNRKPKQTANPRLPNLGASSSLARAQPENEVNSGKASDVRTAFPSAMQLSNNRAKPKETTNSRLPIASAKSAPNSQPLLNLGSAENSSRNAPQKRKFVPELNGLTQPPKIRSKTADCAQLILPPSILSRAQPENVAKSGNASSASPSASLVSSLSSRAQPENATSSSTNRRKPKPKPTANTRLLNLGATQVSPTLSRAKPENVANLENASGAFPSKASATQVSSLTQPENVTQSSTNRRKPKQAANPRLSNLGASSTLARAQPENEVNLGKGSGARTAFPSAMQLSNNRAKPKETAKSRLPISAANSVPNSQPLLNLGSAENYLPRNAPEKRKFVSDGLTQPPKIRSKTAVCTQLILPPSPPATPPPVTITKSQLRSKANADKVTIPSGAVVAFGGVMKKGIWAAQYLCADNTWVQLPRKITMKHSAQFITSNSSFTHISENRVMISGGIESQSLKRVNMLDLASGEITHLPGMKTERSAHASASFRNNVYVAGGQSTSRKIKITHRSVERYDLTNSKWNECSPMITARALFTLAIAHGYMYAIGGVGQDGNILNSVERYDFECNIWTVCEQMNFPRAAAAATVINNELFVIGGDTKLNSAETATVEKYDGNGRWTMIAKLNFAREFLLAGIQNNSVVVVGGFNGNSEMTTIVEKYDSERNEWVLLPPSGKPIAGGVLYEVV